MVASAAAPESWLRCPSHVPSAVQFSRLEKKHLEHLLSYEASEVLGALRLLT